MEKKLIKKILTFFSHFSKTFFFLMCSKWNIAQLCWRDAPWAVPSHIRRGTRRNSWPRCWHHTREQRRCPCSRKSCYRAERFQRACWTARKINDTEKRPWVETGAFPWLARDCNWARGCKWGVYFSRTTTAEAKFGQAPEMDRVDSPRFEME